MLNIGIIRYVFFEMDKFQAFISRLWQALTKSRYTRHLEAENAKLRSELENWQNSLLESVNLPRLTPKASLPPVDLKRRVTPSQWRRAAEKATLPADPKADA